MTTMSALLKRKCKKRAGPEALQLTKGENKKVQEGKKFSSSANRRNNRAPRCRCLVISSSQICRPGWCPVPILVITCQTIHILIHCRWTNSNRSEEHTSEI